MIIFLNNNKDFEKKDMSTAKYIKEETIIYKIFDFLKDQISNDIKEKFKDKKSFTVNKLTNIFEYYLILIFGIIKTEFKNYQIEIEKNKIEEIKKYFEEKHLISKEIYKSALRKLISLFLFKEEDKEKRIKNNLNNVVNYLKIPDIWDYKIYNDRQFTQELAQIKNLKIQINQILFMYEKY